jgi:hypothetical protein
MPAALQKMTRHFLILAGLWLCSQSTALISAETWHDFTYTKIDEQTAEISTPIGTLTTGLPLPTIERRTITALIDHVNQDPQAKTIRTWRLQDSPFTGPRLSGGAWMVIAEGILQSESVARLNELAARQNVERVINDILPRYQGATLTAAVIRHELPKLAQPSVIAEIGDEVSPDLGRLLTTADHAWLAQVLQQEELTTLQTALTTAIAWQPALRWASPDGSLIIERLHNAFDQRVWRLQTPERQIWQFAPAAPLYHQGLRDAIAAGKLSLIARVSPDAQLEAAPAFPLQLSLWETDVQLAAWDSEGGFSSNTTAWRERFPQRDPQQNASGVIVDYLPPHLMWSSPRGELLQLMLPTGTLAAPSPATDFIAEAAAVATTPPLLDLLGQYFLHYVYDSPDPQLPQLPGHPQLRGDIHQTTAQTLAGAVGGICRGDCDDLAEIYQAITRQQNNLTHIIDLPQHAAAAYAEQIDDGYQVTVLQTGPTLQFSAPTVQEALQQAYQSFDAREVFDPNAVGVLLRFSGENTRGPWRLSHRIFTDQDYADTMIEVQKHWHYNTYLQAITIMEKMIADGDRDTANFREMAGLLQFTGRPAEAAEYLELAWRKTLEAVSRLSLQPERIALLLTAGEDQAARDLAEEVLLTELPAAAQELQEGKLTYLLDLVGVLNDPATLDLAISILSDELQSIVGPSLRQLYVQAILPGLNREWWQYNDKALSIRRLLRRYVAHAQAVLMSGEPAELLQDEAARALIDDVNFAWESFIFFDRDTPAGQMLAYSSLGAWQRFWSPSSDFETLVDRARAKAPASFSEQLHTERIGGDAQLQRDLRWISWSPTYFASRAASHLNDVKEQGLPLDRALLQRCFASYQEAFVFASQEALVGPAAVSVNLRNRLMFGLLLEDAAVLRAVFQEVQASGDKRLIDATSAQLGQMARWCSLAWFTEATELWGQEVDYHPKWFWIAWMAVMAEQPQHGIIAAQAACRYHPEDSAFAAELAFMKDLFDN